MDLIFLKIIILLIAAGIAAYTDYKTGYIYNWLTFSLMFIGLLFLIFESFVYLPLGYIHFLKVIIITLVIYGIGYLFYYYGKLGGGDVKFFIALNLLVPYIHNQPFILYVLVFSSLTSVLIVSIRYMFILFKKVKKDFLKILFSKKIKLILYVVMFLFFSYFVFNSINILSLPKLYALVLLPIFFGMFVVLFEPQIKEHIYLKHKPLKEIELGDVIAIEHLSQTLKDKLNLKKRLVLEQEDIDILKSLKIKTFPVYDNLPRFGPYIFIGIIISFLILI